MCFDKLDLNNQVCFRNSASNMSHDINHGPQTKNHWCHPNLPVSHLTNRCVPYVACLNSDVVASPVVHEPKNMLTISYSNLNSILSKVDELSRLI